VNNWTRTFERQVAYDKKLLHTHDYRRIFAQLCRCGRPYRLLRVTVVLTAKDDGSQSLGVQSDGKVTPAEPYLRNPAKHKNADDNYIKDWIQLANQQLLLSGASFGLDVEKICYVLEKSTLLNTVDCSGVGASQAAAVANFIESRANDPSPENPYRDSVILLYRWGADPNQPAGQSCSGVDSRFLLLNRYRETPIIVDGQPMGLGDNQLSHEFGHFMGLDHPFAGDLAIGLADLANLNGRNPLCLPLTDANLVQMTGVQPSDLVQARQDAAKIIKDWPYNYDQDIFGRDDPPPIPADYGVKDTPVDLGVGFPLLFGHTACSGSWQIPVQLHGGNDAQIAVDDKIRGNVMSYWICDPVGQKYSADQVKRMEWVLQNVRSSLIGRTVMIEEICKPNIHEELYRVLPHLPDHWTLPNPEPDWKRIVEALPSDLRRNRRLVDEIRLITNLAPAYRPWQPASLEKHLKALAKSGRLEHLPSANSDAIARYRRYKLRSPRMFSFQ
jgi:hypothetical protein